MDSSRRRTHQERITEKLLRLGRRFLAEEAREHDELCIGHMQLELVRLVVNAPGICISTAADRLGIDKSAVTRAARRLEVVGYLNRRRSTRDRRMWELHPNPGSKRLLWHVGIGTDFAATRMYHGMGAEELGKLDESLTRMLQNLEVTQEMAAFRLDFGFLPRGRMFD